MSIDINAKYYDLGGIETFDIQKAKLTFEQFEGYCIGSAMGYLCRYNAKYETKEDQIREAEKAAIFLNKLVETYRKTQV